MELWKPIPEFPRYEVSNHGNIRKYFKTRGLRLLQGHIDAHGYVRIYPRNNGVRGNMKIHQLIAKLFLDPPKSTNLQLNHKDGDSTNNFVDNLEWVTPRQNIQHFYSMGDRRGKAKVTPEEVLLIRKSTEPYTILAAQYGIQPDAIKSIREKTTWSWL